MPIRYRHVMLTLCAVTVLAAPACQRPAEPAEPAPATAAPTTMVSPPVPGAPAAAPAPRQLKWVDLDTGQCLADPPPTDPAVVIVTVVDCTAAQRAEVFARLRVGVDAAVTDVADPRCAAALSSYTDGGPFAVSYLIDSYQDRTGATPDPSTVICLLHSTDGAPLTGSAAHRPG